MYVCYTLILHISYNLYTKLFCGICLYVSLPLPKAQGDRFTEQKQQSMGLEEEHRHGLVEGSFQTTL